MDIDSATDAAEPREQTLTIEPEPCRAILRAIEIAPGGVQMDAIYTEYFLNIALQFEVVGSNWSTEWYYGGLWPSKDLTCVFGNQHPQTLRIAGALPIGAPFKVTVYEGGGVAEIISRLEEPSAMTDRAK
jgi:hypothetical protein